MGVKRWPKKFSARKLKGLGTRAGRLMPRHPTHPLVIHPFPIKSANPRPATLAQSPLPPPPPPLALSPSAAARTDLALRMLDLRRATPDPVAERPWLRRWTATTATSSTAAETTTTTAVTATTMARGTSWRTAKSVFRLRGVRRLHRPAATLFGVQQCELSPPRDAVAGPQ